MKRGDRVRCIQSYEHDDRKGVREGRRYIVVCRPTSGTTMQVRDEATGEIIDYFWSIDRFVLDAPVTLNPFEWDHEEMWAKVRGSQVTGLEAVVAWACFCYWVVEAPVAWRPTRTVMVELPKDVAEFYATREFIPDHPVVQACQRALGVDA